MLVYIIRRILYAIPILIGINLITFALFFMVNSPQDVARAHLGEKYVTQEAIDNWVAEKGYDQPFLYNSQEQGIDPVSYTHLTLPTSDLV